MVIKKTSLSLNELNNRYLSIDEDVFKKIMVRYLALEQFNLTNNDIFEMVSSSLGESRKKLQEILIIDHMKQILQKLKLYFQN